ncbi:hypothetical protein ABZ479_35425, partial [Streptomyces sp. NPDC005722]
YLALTFGTLLSSQGTEASFETVSPAPPGFPFVVSNLTRSVSRFRSSFPAPYWSGVFISGLSPFDVSDFIRLFRARFPPAGSPAFLAFAFRPFGFRAPRL